MTTYVNPSTRVGGVEQVVVAERQTTIPVDDAPFDDEQYVRVNGEWVPYDAPPIIPDTLAPKPPTSPDANGSISANGSMVDYVLSWVAPTQNTDNSPLTDFAYYVVRWHYAGMGSWTSFVTDETSAVLPGLLLGVNVEWEVLARDYSGNDSTWASDTIVGLVDTVGPAKPSVPVLSSRLGTITATWNGLDNTGAAPPVDFDHLEFYVSATTGGPWTYVDQVSGAGSAIITNVNVGDIRYVTTVAVDTSGNTSVRSSEASITVIGVTGPDLMANSVTTNKIAAGAVDAVAIAADAVTAAKIKAGEVTAGKLAANAVVAGNVSANAIRARELLLSDSTNMAEINESFAIGTVFDHDHIITSGWSTRTATTSVYFMFRDKQGPIPFKTGDRIRVTFEAYSDTTHTAALSLWLYDSAGSNLLSQTIATSGVPLTTTPTAYAYESTVTVDITGKSLYMIGLSGVAGRSVKVRNVRAYRMGAGELIVDGAIKAQHLAAASVSADKITTGSLQAGVEVIAGNIAANHAKMTNLGFKVMVDDPTDGVPNEVVRMGSDTGDLFAITNAAGQIKASISETGQGAFTGLSVDATAFDPSTGEPTEGLTIYGQEFLEYLRERPKGIVAYAVTSSPTWNFSDTETPLFEFAFDGDPAREFWFHIDPMIFDTNAEARVALITRTTVGGTTQPVVTSPLMRQVIAQTAGGLPISLGMDITGQFSYYTRVLVTGVSYTAGATGTVTGNNGVIRAAVYDMGAKKETTENAFVLRYSGASPPSTKTYTSTWNATNSMGYTGSNVADNDSDFKQGYSSYDGDSHGVVVFGGNAVSGETTKTIASALSGATLKKVEVYLYANHWYYNSGGTAIIRAYNSTSLSSATPTGTTKNSASWPKPGGRWVDITSIATTSIRGVTVGKSGGTNLLYYGRFNGHTMSNKPQLRITYVR